MRWAIILGSTGGIAIGYYAAARLSLAYLSKDVAVFWPASGIAAGALMTFGQRVRVPLVIGVVAAAIAANLTVDSLWPSVFGGFCYASGPVLTAWLISRWFGGLAFAFDDLHHVLGFAIASSIGAAASAVGGAATMRLFHATAPFWDGWRTSLMANWVGIVVVAPLIIELGWVRRELPSWAGPIEGIGVLALMVLTSVYVVTHPSGSWISFDPDALVLPLLLWLTARCQPPFGVAGAFVASITIIYAMTFGIGSFGDVDVSITERLSGAQMAVTMVTLCTLVLTALFGERRRNEAALKLALHAEEEGKARLAHALAAGQVTAFEWDVITGLSQCDNAARIRGFEAGGMASPRRDFLGHVHANDRERFETCIRELHPNNPSYALTFRFVHPDGRRVWLEETAKGEFDVNGRLVRIKGLMRDITERKELEKHKTLLINELDHRVKNVLSTVSVIVSQTQDTSSSMADFAIALGGRIRSLARTHDLLRRRNWKGLHLAELVHRELAPYASASNTRIEGSEAILAAEAGQAVAMVLHELATNAAKYGCLSRKGGHVSVRWRLVRNGHAENSISIHWEENGGPMVMPPTRTGYGTSVIRDLIPYELGGTVDLVHACDGVRCKVEIPVKWVIGRTPLDEPSRSDPQSRLSEVRRIDLSDGRRTAESLLAIEIPEIPDVITELTKSQQLSIAMRNLNRLLEDQSDRELGRSALRHLGFPEE